MELAVGSDMRDLVDRVPVDFVVLVGFARGFSLGVEFCNFFVAAPLDDGVNFVSAGVAEGSDG